MKHIITATFIALSAVTVNAAVTFTKSAGGLESVYAEWEPVAGATAYEVTCGGRVADAQLVRQYPGYIRADIPGLPAGTYTLAVKALGTDGAVIESGETAPLTAQAYVREGFAFTDDYVPGAYGLDGSLKEGARVLYITSQSVNTVTLDVVKDKKGTTETVTGLAAILEAKSKGYDKAPLALRFIGQVRDTEFANLKDGNYVNLQGNNNSDRLLEHVTIEGIGNDATLYGYGICFKRTRAIEVRNVAIMLFGDDAVSMDTDNTHIWLHNIDFFYGRPGSDADQVKGDGSIDMKYRSTDISIDHNHFFDSGKVMGCGGTTGETENLRITFHHNWFDHADSRCPRLHYTTAHVYNNYYDGVPVYCIGNTTETSAFVERNYFRNVKRPMMISGQGTDAYNAATGAYDLKGTFSGQDGGMTKAWDNLMVEGQPKVVYQTEHATQFDAYLVENRTDSVPSTVKSVKGAWSYLNFDTAPGFYTSVPDAAADVPAIVTSRGGRVEQGDFKWKFDNAVDDENHDVNKPLKDAILGYATTLVAVQGEEGFGQSGLTAPVADGAAMTVWDIHGRCVGDALNNLPAGVYIVRRGGTATKIVIR